MTVHQIDINDGRIEVVQVGTQGPPGSGAGGGAATFVALTDVPANYTGAGGYLVQVNSGATALEFVEPDYATAAQGALADSAQQPPAEGAFVDGDKTKLDGIEAGAQANDVDTVAGRTGAVVITHADLADFDTEVDARIALAAIGDLVDVVVPAPGDGQVLTWSSGNSRWEAQASGSGVTAFVALNDVPASYAGAGGYLVKVNSGATALEFVAADYATSAQGALADSAVQPADIDTLAELNAIVADATLIDTADSRLSDARTPTAHAASHATGGGDALTPGDIGAATSAQGALADTAVQPTDIDTLAELNAIVGDATLIDTADSRLSDARTPTAHAASHATGGGDDITPAAIGAATSAQGALADSAQQPPSEGAFVDGDKTKLDGIEALADVTDATNVTAAGALMQGTVSITQTETDLGNLGSGVTLSVANGNNQRGTLNVASVTLTVPAAPTQASRIRLRLTNSVGSVAITIAGTAWLGWMTGTAPTFLADSGKRNLLVFDGNTNGWTADGGAIGT